LADCVRRHRLEAAARRLLARPAQRALTIALDVGFASAEVFTRAFAAHFGMTPTAWRRGGWRDWSQAQRLHLRKIHQALGKPDQAAQPAFEDHASHWPMSQSTALKGHAMNVELKTLPAMRLAYLRHTGPYGTPGIGQTWQRFCAWFAGRALLPRDGAMYGISQDDPEITPPEKCRYDCCIEVDAAFQPQARTDEGIGVQDFAGGRYACARFRGTGADIHAAWMQMFGQWLPASGYQAGDAPALEWHDAQMAPDARTGAFSCWLCVPVRPLAQL
jgi:AraC family transcriptional regulator